MTLLEGTIVFKLDKILSVNQDVLLWGGRIIKVVYTSGHFRESISIIDDVNGYIFAGDLVYNGLLLVDDCFDYVQSVAFVMSYSDVSLEE